MATVTNATSSLELNETPHWVLHSGQNKVGQSNGSENMAESIERFRQIIDLQPPGTYKLTGAKNKTDNRGGVSITFTKAADSAATVTQSNSGIMSTNAYNIPDHVLKQIQEEARRTLLFEQMSNQFGPLVDLVKEQDRKITTLEKRLDKVERLLDDEDGDGVPDFMDMTRKATDTIKAAGEIKSVFEGGGIFGKR